MTVCSSDNLHLEVSADTSVSDRQAIVTDEENEAAAERQRAINQQMTNFAKMLTLSIVYSANIGGTATLTGTPTNLIITDAANKSATFHSLLCF